MPAETCKKLSQSGQFTASLFKHVKANKKETLKGANIVYSPVSIHVPLCMLLAGARSNTLRQMQQTLFLSDMTPDHVLASCKEQMQSLNVEGKEVVLSVANRLYISARQEGNVDAYVEKTKGAFEATAVKVDEFSESTRAEINAWVAQATKDKVKDLLPPNVLNALTRLVIVNAVYFKGNWKQQFDVEDTQKGPFTLLDNSTVEVDMMEIDAKYKFAAIPSLGARAVEMPYTGDRFSMVFLLSDDAGGYAAMEAKVGDPAAFDLSSIEFKGEKKLEIRLPKFKIETEVLLNKPLQDMGMTDVFVEGKADLSGIDGTRLLYLSSVFHKAVIEVNEQGAEAAAATAAVAMTRSLPPQSPDFYLDRPFIFYIKDMETKTILFAGCMTNPAVTKKA